MSSVGKFSARLILTAFLCFAPYAFGQGTVTAFTHTGSFVLNRTLLSSFFLHAPNSTDRHHGCDGDRRWDHNCQPVPEGGAAWMYLVLAGLACGGAVVLRSRRQSNAGGSV